MKENILKILDTLGVKSARTKNIVENISISFFYKGGSILASLLLVPLIINYLDTTNYGIWLIITSFISWFTFFDIGLGHGLRNKFTEAKANDNMQLAKAYISSSYFFITIISASLFVLFYIANLFIDWTKVFNTDVNLVSDLSLIMLVVFGCFSIQFIVKLISTIYIADQRPAMQGLIELLTQILLVASVFVLTNFFSSSLLMFSIIFSIVPLLLLVFFNLYAFNTDYQDLKPSFKLFKLEYVIDIMGLGMKFFVIQIAAIVLYTTDNLIITHLFSPADIIPYNVAFKYFSIVTMGFSIIVTPFWSAITDAYAKHDILWIKKSMTNLIKLSFLFSIVAIAMVFIAGWVYEIWVGEEVVISKRLSIFMSLFVITTLLTQPFIFFINGTGKINVQLGLGVFSALLNIPLSIFFAKNLNFGVSGVILATIVANVMGLVVYPIYYKKTIRKLEIE
ncbi:lipopolysaccharide biosynthesis protein [Gelidibacter algens]|uniref:lipopolysaccharide biosynthesis protein n=1 Tax=Gelidibacter algens TaxID=49280 RepID=UPI0014764437|nr:oligosaccharide flippase family protein [Gelidibacter algens]